MYQTRSKSKEAILEATNVQCDETIVQRDDLIRAHVKEKEQLNGTIVQCDETISFNVMN